MRYVSGLYHEKKVLCYVTHYYVCSPYLADTFSCLIYLSTGQ
jgi:hypothetical protein